MRFLLKASDEGRSCYLGYLGHLAVSSLLHILGWLTKVFRFLKRDTPTYLCCTPRGGENRAHFVPIFDATCYMHWTYVSGTPST
ncbi:hypothetical protein BJX62DRAFT_212848 [Aspergillus germanicus]